MSKIQVDTITDRAGNNAIDVVDINKSSQITYQPAGVGAVVGTVEGKLRESVSVLDFGAVGDGVTDDTAAIQAAINYCKTQQTTAVGTLGSGFKSLFFPAGIYKVSSTLTLDGFNGFRMFGESSQTTHVVFTATSNNLFYFQTYLNCSMADMTLSEGALSGSSPVTYTRSVTPANLCIRFNGNAGGAGFQMDRININSFALVFQTTDGTVNCDNHTYNQCVFQYNTDIWNNTNTNAVIWSFNECKVYYTAGTVFKNPGSTLRVNGGDYINPGDFLLGSLANLCTDLVFDGIRFESYQNINPASNPRLMVLSQTHTITFRNCTQRGGGSLENKTTATINGIFNIKLERCWFPGNWAATVGASLGGITSSLVFEECDGVPQVVQTLVGGQGSRPLNIEYRRHRQSTTGYIDRLFHGALPGQNRALSDMTARDMYRFEAVLNASSTNKNCPVFVVSPYIMQFVGAEIEFWSNGIQTVVIDVWTNNSKTTKLGTVTTAVAQNQYQVLEIPLSGVLALHQITSTSDPLFIELTAAANAGTCRANVTLKFRQVN